MEEETNNSSCKDCDEVDAAQLIAEVEHLRRHLAERDTHIVTLEAKLLNSNSQINNLDEQLTTWKEKYERLYDSHRRVQKLNQVLEDKLLQMVDKMKSEKSQLTKDIATLSVRLAESKHNYSMLQKENERYKNDMNLAIQLLQCKPDNFVSQKLDSLPVDTQARVSQYVMSKTVKPLTPGPAKTINDNETFDASEYEFNISASLMSKILEDSIQDTVTKHCDTCTCTKSQAKPFCYNETYYSTATQTLFSGDKNYVCSNCHMDVKSADSNMSIRSTSPVNKIPDYNNKINIPVAPMYVIPEPPNTELNLPCTEEVDDIFQANATNNNICASNVINDIKQEPTPRLNDNTKLKLSNGHPMEPAVHHKLCDHTRASISSKKSSTQSVQEDPLVKEIPRNNEIKSKSDNHSLDNMSIRKNSLSSMGAVSRTSSIAKSTVSTHKSNVHVGPGPRFCHLRMQAGSKNILLDNAEPDVPPVLYRRQSKCNENSIFKDLNDGLEDFINSDKVNNGNKDDNKNENVVESTLIDVQIDNNNMETTGSEKSINPVLMNVSSSPLQPLKTHSFSKNTEPNNNIAKSVTSQQNNTDIDNLLNDFGADLKVDNETKEYNLINTTPTDSHDIKIFNFDRYEQNKISNQLTRPLKKIDMSQLHTLENTKISKDLPPQDENSKIELKPKPVPRPLLPSIVNVYPNLTQTQLKVNESKKVFTNEQSSSSLSSDDSAAFLQKQQLLRVAEWVEKNLEQRNNYNDPLEDEVAYSNNRSSRRGSKLSRAAGAPSEIPLAMPHPVSKYSKSYSRDLNNTRVHNSITSQASNDEKPTKPDSVKTSSTIVKETIFPVEHEETTTTEITNGVETGDFGVGKGEPDVMKEIKVLRSIEKEVTSEELARMEYNVKKFLLSGPYWVKPNNVVRSRRTSSKTETDV